MTDYPTVPATSLPAWVNPIYRAHIEQRRRDMRDARDRARLTGLHRSKP